MVANPMLCLSLQLHMLESQIFLNLIYALNEKIPNLYKMCH